MILCYDFMFWFYVVILFYNYMGFVDFIGCEGNVSTSLQYVSDVDSYDGRLLISGNEIQDHSYVIDDQ